MSGVRGFATFCVASISCLIALVTSASGQILRDREGNCRVTVGSFTTQFGQARVDVWSGHSEAGLIFVIPITPQLSPQQETRPATGFVQIDDIKTQASMNTAIVDGAIEIYYTSIYSNFLSTLSTAKKITTSPNQNRNRNNTSAVFVGDLPSMNFNLDSPADAIKNMVNCTKAYKVLDSYFGCIQELYQFEMACPSLSWKLIGKSKDELYFVEAGSLNRQGDAIGVWLYRRSTSTGSEQIQETLANGAIHCSNLTFADHIISSWDSTSSLKALRASFTDLARDQKALSAGLQVVCGGRLPSNKANPETMAISIRNARQQADYAARSRAR